MELIQTDAFGPRGGREAWIHPCHGLRRLASAEVPLVEPEATESLTSRRPNSRRRGPSTARRRARTTEEARWRELIGNALSHYRIESLARSRLDGPGVRARHLELDRVCALKIMDPRLLARQPSLREQFWAEGRAAANLVHPHVVTVHNLGNARGLSFHRDGVRARGGEPAGLPDPQGPVRARAGREAGAAGRPGPRRGAPVGAGAPRRQAGQRPAHGRGPCEARRFRPGPEPRRSLVGAAGGDADLHGARAVQGGLRQRPVRHLRRRRDDLLPALRPPPLLVRQHRPADQAPSFPARPRHPGDHARRSPSPSPRSSSAAWPSRPTTDTPPPTSSPTSSSS